VSFQLAKQQAVTQVNPDEASLIIVKVPIQWTYGEGRCSGAWRTESTTEAFRGSRGGMLQKIDSPVLETRWGEALRRLN
jgi:hypothetical protein